MDIFQRYEESLTAYNRATGLIDRGSINEAEPLLREALASYPRQVLMEEAQGTDEDIRKTLDTLFENIRSKLIEIDRRRVSQRDVSGEGAGTLQSIVDRNVSFRRPVFPSAAPRGDFSSIDVIPDEPLEAQAAREPEEYAPPVEVVEIPSEEDFSSGVDYEPADAAAPLEAEPVVLETTEAASPLEAEPVVPETAEIEPEPPRERPSAPPPRERGRSDEVEELLHAVDSIRETNEIVSEDDYRISDEVFLAGPIDDEDDEEVLEPLPAHIDEPCEERGDDAAYTWTEEDEEVILKTGGPRPSGSFLGGLMEKVRSFFRRKESSGRVQESPPGRAPEFEPDADLPGEQEAAGGEPAPESESGVAAEEDDLKGTDMEQDMESSESAMEEQPAAPAGEEEVLSEEETWESGDELTLAEEILMKERSKEEAAKKTAKMGVFTKVKSLFSKKSGGGAPSARKEKAPQKKKVSQKKKAPQKKKGSRKRKTGLFSLSVSATSIFIILLGMGAALAFVSMYPVYTKVSLLNRIDKAFTNGDVDAATRGYIRLARETGGDQDAIELISESAAARARAMISGGEASKAVGMLSLLLAEVVSDENLRILLVDAYVTKAVAAAESGDLDSAKNMVGLIETEMKLLRGGVPPGVSGKYSRLRALIMGKKSG